MEGRKKRQREKGKGMCWLKTEQPRVWTWWPQAQLDLGVYMASLNLVTIFILFLYTSVTVGSKTTSSL